METSVTISFHFKRNALCYLHWKKNITRTLRNTCNISDAPAALSLRVLSDNLICIGYIFFSWYKKWRKLCTKWEESIFLFHPPGIENPANLGKTSDILSYANNNILLFCLSSPKYGASEQTRPPCLLHLSRRVKSYTLKWTPCGTHRCSRIDRPYKLRVFLRTVWTWLDQNEHGWETYNSLVWAWVIAAPLNTE